MHAKNANGYSSAASLPRPPPPSPVEDSILCIVRTHQVIPKSCFLDCGYFNNFEKQRMKGALFWVRGTRECNWSQSFVQSIMYCEFSWMAEQIRCERSSSWCFSHLYTLLPASEEQEQFIIMIKVIHSPSHQWCLMKESSSTKEHADNVDERGETRFAKEKKHHDECLLSSHIELVFYIDFSSACNENCPTHRRAFGALILDLKQAIHNNWIII